MMYKDILYVAIQQLRTLVVGAGIIFEQLLERDIFTFIADFVFMKLYLEMHLNFEVNFKVISVPDIQIFKYF